MDAHAQGIYFVHNEHVHNVHEVDTVALIEIIEGKVEVEHDFPHAGIDLRFKSWHPLQQNGIEVLHKGSCGELIKNLYRVLLLLSDASHVSILAN